MIMNCKLITLSVLLTGWLLTSCQDHTIPSAPASIKVTTVTQGLVTPISVETDVAGRVFVAEQGTGKNDGTISEITPDGKKHPLVTGIFSQTNTEGDLDAVDHLLIVDNTLYFLNPKGLYQIDLSTYKTDAKPAIPASSLTPQDIRKFVLDYNFTNDTGESHLYNLTRGPEDALFIADAAANAIIRRSKTGELSVVAEVPGIKNPTPVGPPFIQAVPTGIVFDGQNFLVSTLIGFPFPPGQSIIYKISPAGAVSIYKQGFTSLVDINLDTNPGVLVVQHGVFGAQGFAANTGQIIRANAVNTSVVVDKLNLPTDLKQSNANTYYVTSLGDGALLKITY